MGGDTERCVGALEVAPYAVDRLRKSGYELVGMDTCIGNFHLVSFPWELLMSCVQVSKLDVLMSESSSTRAEACRVLICMGRYVGKPAQKGDWSC